MRRRNDNLDIKAKKKNSRGENMEPAEGLMRTW